MKKILMIATGGTIASKRSESGLSPQMKSDEILAYVPKVREVCEVSALQLMNIDSTNVTPDDWVKMAETIRDNYDGYDGFVLCHGTDTMAYTAAVLSYLIPKSPKPIVITGAQKPIDMEITDARTNLFDSFLYCSSNFACGVSIVFDGKVINGARAKKMYSKSFNAFSSINYPHIAVISGGKIIRYIDKKYSGKPVFYNKLNGKVGLFKLIPGANPELLDYYFKKHDAVVVESFGTGGIPDAYGEEFYKVIEKWQKKGKVLVMCTQVVNEGSDMTVYKVGKSLKEKYGFLESYDMTLEAVVAKLMWILANTKNTAKIKKLFYKNIVDDILYVEE
ncbi:MAG: asparaginase [Clostridiales bacterium]|nr:asparaginase [Clostridiales bacterium]